MRAAVLVLMLASAGVAAGATFTVTNTADFGAGSLRQAILDANGAPGADTIAFNIAGAGVHTIVLGCALPAVTDVVTLDGYTQPGLSAEHAAARAGNERGPPDRDQRRRGRSRAVPHVVRRRRTDPGPDTQPLPDRNNPRRPDRSRSRGNFLGTTPQGGPLTDGSPQNRGIYALGAQSEPLTTDVVVGGPDPADRNLISGHTSFQLSRGRSADSSTRASAIRGNLIGVDATASYTISNGIGVFSGGHSRARRRWTRRRRGQRHRRKSVGRIFRRRPDLPGQLHRDERRRDGRPRQPRWRLRRQRSRRRRDRRTGTGRRQRLRVERRRRDQQLPGGRCSSPGAT